MDLAISIATAPSAATARANMPASPIPDSGLADWTSITTSVNTAMTSVATSYRRDLRVFPWPAAWAGKNSEVCTVSERQSRCLPLVFFQGSAACPALALGTFQGTLRGNRWAALILYYSKAPCQQTGIHGMIRLPLV
jgi:hypothetical protein